MARILIDGRFIGIGDSISRYTLEILKGILKLDKKNDYTILIRPQGIKTVGQFFKSELINSKHEARNSKQIQNSNETNSKQVSDFRFQISDFQNLRLQILDVPHYSFAEQTKLLKYLNSEKFDLVHFAQFNHPILYRGNYVITIFDLTLLGHLHRQHIYKRLAFRQVMKSAVKNSKKILTTSDTSKKEISEYFNVQSEKITITSCGVDENFNNNIKSIQSVTSSFKKKYGIDGDYLLYTGMWKRHKNILRMLSAFERYIADKKVEELDIQLVLVGKIDKDEPEVLAEINRINNSDKYKKADKKVFVATGFIEEEELPIAYAGALAYVIPSLSEGFGLPPLEAMACGTPVISSNESCMPEILGNAPLYFDPYKIDEIAIAMKRIIKEEDLRKELAEKGLVQAGKYTWDKTAEGTLEVYKEVLKG